MSVETALVKVNQITVYQSDIELVTADYIQSLPDESMIYKSAVFSGLLDAIYKRLLKPIITRDNGLSNRALNYTVLDNIFRNVYIPLCYRFNITPTVIQFSTLCNISNSNLTEIKNGVYYSGGKVNKADSEIVRKWYQVCESGLYSKAIGESSIGAIFGLKAVHGYSDSQTIRLETAQTDSHETAEQIAAKHSNAMIPQKPDLNSSE